MPAFLQFATVCAILSLVSNAVLAVVVTQTPRHAFASHTGVMGVGVGVGVGVVLLLFVLSVVPPSVLLHANTNSMERQRVRMQVIFLIAEWVSHKINKTKLLQPALSFKYST